MEGQDHLNNMTEVDINNVMVADMTVTKIETMAAAAVAAITPERDFHLLHVIVDILHKERDFHHLLETIDILLLLLIYMHVLIMKKIFILI